MRPRLEPEPDLIVIIFELVPLRKDADAVGILDGIVMVGAHLPGEGWEGARGVRARRGIKELKIQKEPKSGQEGTDERDYPAGGYA